MIRIINDYLTDDKLLEKCLSWQPIQDERSTYRALWGRISDSSIAIELSSNLQTNFLAGDFDQALQTDEIISTYPCRMAIHDAKPMLVPASKKQDENFLFLTTSSRNLLEVQDIVVSNAEIIIFMAGEVDGVWVLLTAAKMGKGGYLEIPEPASGSNPQLAYRRYSYNKGSHCFSDESRIDDVIKVHRQRLKTEKASIMARPKLLPRLERLNCILEGSTWHYPAFGLGTADIFIDATYLKPSPFQVTGLPRDSMRYNDKNVLQLEQFTLQLVAEIEPLSNVADVELLVRILHADPIGNVRLCQSIAYALTWHHPLQCSTVLAFPINCRFTSDELSHAHRAIMKWEFQRLLCRYQFGADRAVTQFQQEGVLISLGSKKEFFDYFKEDYLRLQNNVDYLERRYRRIYADRSTT